MNTKQCFDVCVCGGSSSVSLEINSTIGYRRDWRAVVLHICLAAETTPASRITKSKINWRLRTQRWNSETQISAAACFHPTSPFGKALLKCCAKRRFSLCRNSPEKKKQTNEKAPSWGSRWHYATRPNNCGLHLLNLSFRRPRRRSSSCWFWRPEIQSELHTNTCAMWFEWSSVKVIAIRPNSPCGSKWSEFEWWVNGRLQILTARTLLSSLSPYSHGLCVFEVVFICRL